MLINSMPINSMPINSPLIGSMPTVGARMKSEEAAALFVVVSLPLSFS